MWQITMGIKIFTNLTQNNENLIFKYKTKINL